MADDDILSIVEPTAPDAGGETGASGANTEGAKPSPTKRELTVAEMISGVVSDPEPAEEKPAGDGEQSKPEGEEVAAKKEEPETIPKKRLDEVTFHRREAERKAEEASLEAAYWKGVAEGRIPQQGQPQPGQPGAAQPGQDPNGPPADIPPHLAFQVPAPKPEQFQDSGQYMAAMSIWATQKTLHETSIRQQLTTHNQREQAAVAERQAKALSFFEEAEKAHPDFKEVFHKDLSVTPHMGAALVRVEGGHDVAYYLGKKPEEAGRIAKLSPEEQLIEIGRISERIKTARANKKPTSAPDPINTVGSGSKEAEAFDPVHGPKDINAWMEWDRKRSQKR